jgi:hypothetical protein
MGLDVIYTKLNTMSKGLVATLPATGTQEKTNYTFDDQDAWVVYFRVHKDFYP